MALSAAGGAVRPAAGVGRNAARGAAIAGAARGAPGAAVALARTPAPPALAAGVTGRTVAIERHTGGAGQRLGGAGISYAAGIAYGSLGSFPAAIAEFRQALAIDPASPDARRNLELAQQAAAGAQDSRP